MHVLRVRAIVPRSSAVLTGRVWPGKAPTGGAHERTNVRSLAVDVRQRPAAAALLGELQPAVTDYCAGVLRLRHRRILARGAWAAMAPDLRAVRGHPVQRRCRCNL